LKIRLDENLSWRVVEAIRGFMTKRPGFEIDWVRDHHPPGTSDPTWLRQFASDGGDAIISGDARILSHFPDLVAYKESGLIGFFPPPKFDDLRGAGQAALIMRWWPAIVEKLKISARGDTWRFPLIWSTPDVSKFEDLRDPRLDAPETRKGLGIGPVPALHPFRPPSGDGREP
jgi:hypothetical protein